MDLSSLNFTIFYAHKMLAAGSGLPELELSQAESDALATSAQNVMKHYNIKTSQKTVDWANLLMTMGVVYGGRISQINERSKREKRERRAAAQAEVEAHAAAPFGLSPGMPR